MLQYSSGLCPKPESETTQTQHRESHVDAACLPVWYGLPCLFSRAWNSQADEQQGTSLLCTIDSQSLCPESARGASGLVTCRQCDESVVSASRSIDLKYRVLQVVDFSCMLCVFFRLTAPKSTLEAETSCIAASIALSSKITRVQWLLCRTYRVSGGFSTVSL